MTTRTEKLNYLVFVMYMFMCCVFVFSNFYIYHGLGDAGRYYSSFQMIVVYPRVTGLYAAYDTFDHEFGHHIYMTQLTPAERREYQEIYKNTSEYVSTYAEPKCGGNCRRSDYDDASEDFAECFRVAVDKGIFNYSQIPEDRQAFIKDHLEGTIPLNQVRK